MTMTNPIYGPQSLSPNSIGGNGFWLANSASTWMFGFDASGFDFNQALHNTNDAYARAVGDLDSTKLLNLYFEQDTRITFSKVEANHRDYICGRGGWHETATGLGTARASSVERSSNIPLAKPQHMDRVQFNNITNLTCMAVERVEFNTPGCQDVLPGLYLILVSSAPDSAGKCTATIKPFDNARTFWTAGNETKNTLPQYDLVCSFGCVLSPYLTENISIVADGETWNYNVIPGLRIKLKDTARAGDAFVVSVGYEYINPRSEAGTMGAITGTDAFYLPLADLGVQPLGSNPTAHTTNNDYGWSTIAAPTWTVFNVSNSILEDVTLHIWPLVRLQQKISQRPFVSWFMGCNAQTQFEQNNAATYRLLFRNIQTVESIKYADLICSAAIDMVIRVVNPTTMQPTGETFYAGRTLRCDGTTLYLWEGAGVYFQLSTGIQNYDSAQVHVRRGAEFLAVRNKQAAYDAYPAFPIDLYGMQDSRWIFGPTDYPIGTWDSLEDNDGNKFPADDLCSPESYHTGKMAPQGHDLAYSLPALGTRTHWYDHYFQCIWNLRMSADPTLVAENPFEAAIVITCSDPKYFKVAPMSWLYSNSKRYRADAGSVGESADPLIYSDIKITQLIGEVVNPGELKTTVNIADTTEDIVVRMNQIPAELAAVYEDLGVGLVELD